ncbi:MAG: glycoside hydrolase family 32 protein [Gammaproteobacteria bacterium]|nr:glycoside hydrolase family 32 protein [Gammaproteobacteria bacterium]
MTDYRSKVPLHRYPDTLAEQEAVLASHPMMERLARSRTFLAENRHRPVYHYVNPEGTLNDPNGLCRWQGRWHLFYQAYPPEDPRQHWGHAVSEDLIHWRDLPYCIYPDPERCCFSGATLVEDDRVIAMYHGTEAGNMVAVSSDPLLLNWSKVGDAPVIPMAGPDDPPLPYRVFDPCIWKHGENYYSLSAGQVPEGPGGMPVAADFLFRSDDLQHWEYLHPFTEDDRFTRVGDDGACPYFWPIGDKHVLLFFSHMSGGQYLLGDYDTNRQRLVVTGAGKFNMGPVKPCGVHAPSATPDGRDVVVIFNMNPGKPSAGWNQIMSLPRRLSLGDGDELLQEPVEAVASCRQSRLGGRPQSLPANREVVLDDLSGDALEIRAVIAPSAASMVELNVLRSPNREEVTRIAFYRDRGYRDTVLRRHHIASLVTLDTSYSSSASDVSSRAPETAPVRLGTEEPLELRVFVDKSIVEAFVNGKQCVAARVYPDRADSTGISFRSQGRASEITELDVWEMGSIY